MMIWIISENDIIRTILDKIAFYLSIRSQLQENELYRPFSGLKVEYAIGFQSVDDTEALI